MEQGFFDVIGQEKPLLGLSYGLGVDSTAIIVGLVQQGIRPDFITFADVGSEKETTYAYLPYINEYLRKHNFPEVTVVYYQPKTAPYDNMEYNMVMNCTLPGTMFGKSSCTVKFKIKPQEKHEREKFGKSRSITKMIGFEAGEEYRKDKASDKAYTANTRYNYLYPLQEWGWDREECKARIAEAGLYVPDKSACIVCPHVKEYELETYTPEERGRLVRMECYAEPFNKKVQGIWGKGRKRDNRPGSVTKYMLENNIEFVHPDKLEFVPINPACKKGREGFNFKGPHVDPYSISNLIDCKCSRWENHFHNKLIKELEYMELNLEVDND